MNSGTELRQIPDREHRRRRKADRTGAHRRWALIRNLDTRIRDEIGLSVAIADDPLASVVLGTGRLLSDFKLLHRLAID